MADADPDVSMITLAQYRERLSHLHCPSVLQAKAFAEHVAGAHSWYKHLPVKSGYSGFGFYLDPNSGQDVWWDARDGVRVVPRMSNDTPFHHSWQTTAAAIENFGYLNYCRYLPGQASSIWIVDGTELISVPDELLRQTYVECTALIHPNSQSLRHMYRLPNYRQLFDADTVELLQNPEERRLAEILRIADDDYSCIADLQDEYADIVSAIRNKQIEGVVNAIALLGKLMTGEYRNA